MKIKNYKCHGCGSDDFYAETSAQGNKVGLYCLYCGKWLKWANKEEKRLLIHGQTGDDIVENEEDRAGKAFNFAYLCYLRSKVLQYTPKYFIIGFCLYYKMVKAAEVKGLSCWENAAHDDKLFGIPVKISKENEWSISLFLDEFTFDFKGTMKGE